MIARIKKDSAPESPEDGDLVANFTRDDMSKYKVDPYEIGPLEDGETYYVRLFPYSDHNVVNINPKFTYHETIKRYYIWGFHQDFTNLDPDSCITYVRDNENWEPMHCCPDTGTFTHGSWDQWSWLQQVRPFMIKRSDGLIDYALDPNDYSKKIDGTPSDIGTVKTTNLNDAYVWIPRLFMKETYDSDGNGRTVLFALDRNNDETKDFKNYYFRGKNTSDVDGYAGYWFGMYYMGQWNYSIPGDCRTTYGDAQKDEPFKSNSAVDYTQYRYPSEVYSRWAYAGGTFFNFLRDVEYMLFKSTDVQKHVGAGMPTVKTNPGYNLSQYNDVINRHGAFYGTYNSRGPAKMFHSVALASYAFPIKGNISYNYQQGITMTDMFTKETVTITNWIADQEDQGGGYICFYPNKLHLSNLGSIVYSFAKNGTDNNGGSTETGLCDAFNLQKSFYNVQGSSYYEKVIIGLGQLAAFYSANYNQGLGNSNISLYSSGPATIGNVNTLKKSGTSYYPAYLAWISALLPPTQTYTPYNDEA